MSRERAAHYSRLLGQHYLLNTLVRAEGCTGLPPHLKGVTCLQLGLNVPVRIDPLTVDADGITAGLSFDRRVHTVFIPWRALIGVRAGDYVVMLGPAATKWAAAQCVAELTPRAQLPVLARRDNVVAVDFKARRRA